MAQRKRNSFVRENLLTILTIGGVFGGCITGFILKGFQSEPWKPRDVMYIQFLGDLFLRMLKGLIIPLLISSVVSAIGSLDLSLSRLIGARAITWYVCTTMTAVMEGIALVLIIKPGVGNTAGATSPVKSRNVTTVDTLLDLVRNMFPPNIVEACVGQYRTVLIPPKNMTSTDILDWELGSEYTGGSNIMGLVVFSCVLGIAIGQAGASGIPLLKLFQSLGDVVMMMTNWVIWLSPVGIFFLVAAKIIEMKSISETIGHLGLYFLTVVVGLIFHGFILLPFFFFLITRKSPIPVIINLGQAIVTAFGTASSSASLPVSMMCVEEKNNVDPRVSRFIMPIGATINMDGTALYEAVAAIFIAQLRNVPLGFGHIVGVSITATMASISAAAIPQAGLVTMVMVLETVGLPAEDVTLIIAVDWLLDRIRTTVNVLGDGLGASIVQHLSERELDVMTELPMKVKTTDSENHIDS